ncbi:uncharacterized protein Z518_01829 [Rhinocladiella mackenziei CBS 650.93]|uniref:HNH nuclease domain-containing protein n=1 Tax=Rhinocladiella mackenziei CBS 650.93 TaxID=1442369 RepID=A0A0D2IVF3_9EURO|nr:uncharacterized protein Z518_01829 [Rhinocladiella mackenziei CBS 650.93]KIX07176.1 hypothetical protein Z518_01829 [Rhinocladiella mackenziei CBS 650.93]
MSETSLSVHSGPPHSEDPRTPPPAHRCDSPPPFVDHGQGAVNLPGFRTEARYNTLLQAIYGLDAMDRKDKSVVIVGFFSPKALKDNHPDTKQYIIASESSQLVVKSMLETQDLSRKVIQLAKDFKQDSPDRVKHIDKYLRTIITLHHMLSLEALKVHQVLYEIQEKRAEMDRIELTDVRPEIRESIRTGKKRKASSTFPSGNFIEFNEDDLEMLQDKYNSHSRLMEHAETWRNEILNAVTDGAPLNAIAMMFSLDTVASCLGAAGIAETGNARADLRKQSIAYYDAKYKREDREEQEEEEEDTENRHCLLWCPVTKRWWPREVIKNAHIIPANTPEGTIRYCFGELNAKAMLNSSRNFILLHARIEEAFDRGQISIVPVSDAAEETSQQPSEFRIFFIDRSLVLRRKAAVVSSKNEILFWGDLARDPQLKFQNNNRPGHRNLFWHCLTSLAKAKSRAHIGLTAALTEFERKEVWNKPGKWIEKGMLRDMAHQHMMPQIYREDATFVDDGTLEKMEKDIAITALFRLSSPRVQSDLDVEESNLEALTHPNFAPEEYFSPQALLPLSPGTEGFLAIPVPSPTPRWERARFEGPESPTPGARLFDTFRGQASRAFVTTTHGASKTYNRVSKLSLRLRKD